MSASIRRRTLIAGTAAATTALLLPFRGQSERQQRASAPASFVDILRQEIRYDSVHKCTHGWLNCRSQCEWDVYVRDGYVIREEQTATYAEGDGRFPDFNPRGCQKGACYSSVMYGPSRLTVPLKRAGERGDNRWKRISWDQAIDEITDKMLDAIEEQGPESIIHDLGPHFDNGPTTLGRVRFFGLMGATIPDDWAEIGDLSVGATMTLGIPHLGGSSNEWFLSDTLIVWNMNPSVTQMPDAHYLWEAKYNGSKVIVIAPEYGATALHADLWMPIKPGTDAALALYCANRIMREGLWDRAYVCEQTDLPLLVFADTGRFVRESDIEQSGRDDVFYVWDRSQNKAVIAAGGRGLDNPSLRQEVDPALEGNFKLLLNGKTRSVAPMAVRLMGNASQWTLKQTAERTTLPEQVIEQFYRMLVSAERPMILSSWGSNRAFHSDLMNRCKLLLLSLLGKIGVEGAGYHATGWVSLEGFEASTMMEDAGLAGLGRMIMGTENLFDKALDLITQRKSMNDLSRQLTEEDSSRRMSATNSASLNFTHAGVAPVIERELAKIGDYPRPLSAYQEEAIDKDWMAVLPRPDQIPRVWVTGGNNVLRRTNQYETMRKVLWPKLKCIADINFKKTYTGLWSDYLLPAAGYYEKVTIKYPVAYCPYLHYGEAAVPPIGEAKDEWEISVLLARKLTQKAKQRKTKPVFVGKMKRKVDLQNYEELFTFGNSFGPKDAEKVAQQILDLSTPTNGMKTKNLKKTGIERYKAAGFCLPQGELYNTDWSGEDDLLVAVTDITREHRCWPTLTGRQQYYIDHPWFLEAGEALPVHKDPPKAGGDYPLQFVSSHTRWSVHSIWKDTQLLLRLQRGEPLVYINPDDAKSRNIKDGEFARMYNELGEMRMRVKVTAMVQPGMAFYYHAWEPYQFPDHASYKRLIPGLIKPLHYAGGYGQVQWYFAHWAPGTHVQDTRIEMERWTA